MKLCIREGFPGTEHCLVTERKITPGLLLEALKDFWNVSGRNAVFYHMETGRFLDPSCTLVQNQVFDGETIWMFIQD